jgi:hypothetical protein
MAGRDHGGGFSLDAAVRIEGRDLTGASRDPFATRPDHVVRLIFYP